MNINTSKRVTVIGGGFAGLTTAHYLLRAGVGVRLLEKNDHPGGLIGTRRTPHGLVETAANGILNSSRFEALCEEAGIGMIEPRKESRARYIWRGEPRRFPLTAAEVLRIGSGLLTNIGRIGPQPGETITHWGGRVLGAGATYYGLSTALGGIYAGDSDRMSASLIFSRGGKSKPKAAKPRVRGTVAPAGGMGELIDGLAAHLKRQGAEIIYGAEARLTPGEPTVICTSAAQAADLLAEVAPDIATALERIEMLSLVTVTCFYRPVPEQLNGFGCLFPRDQGFRARGVLMNDAIFDGRSDQRSETWILGGALDPRIIELSDEELEAIIATDHARFTGRNETPLGIHITRWPRALPHYDLTLERTLPMLGTMPSGIVLAGNYLGGIGLARILDRSAAAAEEMLEKL